MIKSKKDHFYREVILVIVALTLTIAFLSYGLYSTNKEVKNLYSIVNDKTTPVVENGSDSNEEENIVVDNSEIRTEYLNLLSSFEANSILEYATVDINGDGIDEFIIKTGTSEADMLINVYGYNTSNKEIILSASLSGSHSSLYLMNDNRLYIGSGQMGSGTDRYYEYSKGILKLISETNYEIGDGENYHTGDQEITLIDVRNF